MRCEQASEMMSLRLDDCLDNAAVILLENHLAECSACQAEWEKLQTLDRLLTSATMVRPPVRMRVQVMTRLERREHARRAIIGSTALALGTVALVLLILAPAFLSLLNVAGITPTLLSGGPKTITQILSFACTMGRAVLVVAKQLAIPLALLGMGGLVAVLGLNGLWIGAVRRLRAPYQVSITSD